MSQKIRQGEFIVKGEDRHISAKFEMKDMKGILDINGKFQATISLEFRQSLCLKQIEKFRRIHDGYSHIPANASCDLATSNWTPEMTMALGSSSMAMRSLPPGDG